MMLLAGDIGGTKTMLALYEPGEGVRKPRFKQTFPSIEYGSLSAIVRAFLAETGAQVNRASFGVAGPVVAGRASITNLPWEIDAQALYDEFGFAAVTLLNDLEAIAYAIPQLAPEDLHTLNIGVPEPTGALAVIAPGTGLGEAFLTWDGHRYRAWPSEGGHASFAPAGPLEMDLLNYLWSVENFRHVSYERVCSGLGLPNIYRFLRHSGYAEEPAWLAEQIAAADDPTPLIVGAAMGRDIPVALCVAALDMFVAILGSEAANLGLKVLATGGVFLGGGIPPRILPALGGSHFMQAFLNKGRFSDMVGRMPVHVIIHSNAALLGAACAGIEER